MNSQQLHIWNCLNSKVQRFKSLKVLFKKKLDLLDQHIRRPTSHIHSLFKIGSISYFSSKTQNCKFETTFFELFPAVNSVTKRKKRRSWFSQNPAVVPVCFPKHPTTAPKAVKTLFLLSWSDFPFYFKHWLKIVYLHFYIFCCCRCLSFG